MRMLDLKFIRENRELVEERLAAKRAVFDLGALLAIDQSWRKTLHEIEELRGEQNAANEVISQLKVKKESADSKIAEMKELSRRKADLEPRLKELQTELYVLLSGIPNLPHESVPVGDKTASKVIRSWGKAPKFSFKPKTHVELAEELDIIDFKRAAKLSGSNFILFKKEGARLERALINFMLDIQTGKHGYTEMSPPILVNTAAMMGTGQLPKMAEDMYKLSGDDLYLIPTAEVPVTNIHRDEVLEEEDLPLYYTAYTPCFRREAGSYGKETKGLIRVHQFDKVEMVKFVHPDYSYDELESLVLNAEYIFQLLKLPYRVLLLASGDLSFAAAKCYDIEVYAGGVGQWLECSSCSNFEDFQARRANIKFKDKTTKKPAFVHTLNGSGVALARTVVAILENNQNEKGHVLIPKVLWPYTGGMKEIKKI